MMKRQAFNPYLPEGQYIPDGEPHVFGDRVYVYGSCDLPNGKRFCPGDYAVWSAPLSDLSDWSVKGVALPRKNVWNKSGYKCMWAPDCTRGADGMYYLYFSFGFENRICVAKSNAPDGPFEPYGEVKHADGTLYGSKRGDNMCFDPGVFTDDDGQTYLYSGFSPKLAIRLGLKFKGLKNVRANGGQVMKLESDMLTLKSAPKMSIPGYKNSAGTGFEGYEFYEASSLRKIGGRYYFVYSTINSHELAYAVSDRPDGNFEFGGVIISNGDIGLNGNRAPKNYWGNNHGSLACVRGQWYIFYHKQTNKTEQSRQGCAEPIEIGADGRIAQVEMTSCGLNGGPLAGSGEYPAYIACGLRSALGACKCAYGPVQRWKYAAHPCITQKGNAQYIENLKGGASVTFKYFDIKELEKVSVTVRGHGGNVSVFADGEKAPVAVIQTKDSADWRKFEGAASLFGGVHSLTFVFEGKGCDFIRFGLA